MEIKLNKGSVFLNKNKTAENHPDMKGKINAEGKVLEISMWKNVSASGVEYFSVSLSEPWVNPNPQPNVQPRKMGNIESNFQEEAIRDMQEEDDDLPF